MISLGKKNKERKKKKKRKEAESLCQSLAVRKWSAYIFVLQQHVWLGTADCFHQEAHQGTREQSITPASSAARAANKL